MNTRFSSTQSNAVNLAPAVSHLPRVAVLSAPKERWRAQDFPESAATMNGVEAWVYAFGGDFIGYDLVTKHDLAQYDLIIANSNTTYIPRLIELAEQRSAHTRWVTLIEGDAGDYLKPLPAVQRIFEVSDLVNCINQPSLPLFQALGAGKRARVEYVGIPYPIEGVRRFAVAPEQRFDEACKNIFLCPFLLNRWNEWLVARQIAEECAEECAGTNGEMDVRYYGYVRPLSRKISNWRELWQERSLDKRRNARRVERLYNDARLEVRFASGLEEFFALNSQAVLWLNLDDRHTWGRYVLDAATLGIPIITTTATGHAEHCFPETTVPTEFSLPEAVQLGKRLLADRQWYVQVSTQAFDYVQAFAPAAMVQKLLALLVW
jgi:hypothetical protein